MQTEATTSGLLSHLRSQHPSKFTLFKKEKLRLEREATGSKRAIDEVLDELEGLATPPSKRHRTETGSVSGVKTIMKTPFTSSRPSTLRHEIQGRMQKKFDLWVTELWVRMGLPWSLLDHPAYKDFWRRVDAKYHLKHSSVFSRSKLGHLYREVKKAVDKQIAKEVQFTTGVGLTSDHWTSRNMDPYLGVTLHVVTKDWKLAR